MALDQEKARELSQKICETLDEYDTETALAVLVGVCGQVLAHLAQGIPSRIQSQGSALAANIKAAAIAKILHDDEVRRQQGQ